MDLSNEGVLIKALINNTTVVPLHFYYVNGTEDKNNRIPTVTFINSSFLNLAYNDTTTYIVPLLPHQLLDHIFITLSLTMIYY